MSEKKEFDADYLRALAAERWRYIFGRGGSGVPTKSERAIDYALKRVADELDNADR
jgi:hypothetical protein